MELSLCALNDDINDILGSICLNWRSVQVNSYYAYANDGF